MPIPSVPTHPQDHEKGLWHLSASQIELFRRCPRAWFLKYITKLPEPARKYLFLGKALHAVAERYLLKQPDLYPHGWDFGLTDAERDWIQAGAREAIAKNIWPAAPGAFVEYPICMLVGPEHMDRLGNPTLADPEVYLADDGERRVRPAGNLPAGTCFISGFIDYYAPVHVIRPYPAIADHKTAKNRRYAKTQKHVQDSVQLKLYALYIYRKTGWKDIEASFNNFLKDVTPDPFGPPDQGIVHQVTDTYRAEALLTFWRGVLDDYSKIKVLRGWTGDKWDRIQVVLDDERCRAYGGCPGRELCLGRCNIAQLRHRLENPHAFVDAAPALKAFPLNLRGKIQPTNPPAPVPVPIALSTGPIGVPMPFPQSFRRPSDPPKIGDTVFVADPSMPYQYRGEVVVDGAEEFTVALWPDANLAPATKTLDALYIITLPKAEVTKGQHPDRVIKGYAEALREAGSEAPAWQPATGPAVPQTQAAAQPAPEAAPTPTPPATTEPEGEQLFSASTVEGAMALVPAALAQAAEKRKRGRPRKNPLPEQAIPPALPPVTAASSNPTAPLDAADLAYIGPPAGGQATPPPPPAPDTPVASTVATYMAAAVGVPTEGDVVMILPGQDGFWADKAFQRGFVISTLTGDGKTTATVVIGDHEYPDIDVVRLKIVEPAVASRFGVWVGKPVHVVAKTGAILRYTLEKLTVTGLKFEDVATVLPFEQVASLCGMQEAPIPGDANDAARVDNDKIFATLDLMGHLAVLRQRIGEAKIAKKALVQIEDALSRTEKYTKSLPIEGTRCDGPGSHETYEALADKAIQAVVAALKGVKP